MSQDIVERDQHVDTEPKGLTSVRRYLSGRTEVTAAEVVAYFEGGMTNKQTYNALTYLSRTGELEKAGHGRYRVKHIDIDPVDWRAHALALASIITTLTAERVLGVVDWQPIETAPTDRAILLYEPLDQAKNPLIEGEGPKHGQSLSIGIGIWCYSESGADYWGCYYDLDELMGNPTHWAEVPTPPRRAALSRSEV